MDDLKGAARPELLRGALAGAAAGLFASWAMNRVYGVWSTISRNHEQPEQSAERGVNTDPATIAMVNKMSRRFLGRALTDEQARLADLIGHYAIGAAGGAVYGGFSEYLPQVRARAGAAFGTAFFLLGEELAVPILGLSAKPWQIPAESHAVGFLAHLVYGITTEISRHACRQLL
ncbi:MAG TPA: DUF1440 domain-containing protein [Terriglobales bacterium]|nr:DUF1440 domain-containing protein [Terriglobales bacterium]